MSNDDRVREIVEDVIGHHTRATIETLRAEAQLDTQRSLGRLEANVSHLQGSADKIDKAVTDQAGTLKEHGDILKEHGADLKRISRRQIYGSLIVVAAVTAFGFLSEHWPAMRRLGDLLFGQGSG